MKEGDFVRVTHHTGVGKKITTVGCIVQIDRFPNNGYGIFFISRPKIGHMERDLLPVAPGNTTKISKAEYIAHTL